MCMCHVTVMRALLYQQTLICKAACSSYGCAELILLIVGMKQSFVTCRAGLRIRDFGQKSEHAKHTSEALSRGQTTKRLQCTGHGSTLKTESGSQVVTFYKGMDPDLGKRF